MEQLRLVCGACALPFSPEPLKLAEAFAMCPCGDVVCGACVAYHAPRITSPFVHAKPKCPVCSVEVTLEGVVRLYFASDEEEDEKSRWDAVKQNSAVLAAQAVSASTSARRQRVEQELHLLTEQHRRKGVLVGEIVEQLENARAHRSAVEQQLQDYRELRQQVKELQSALKRKTDEAMGLSIIVNSYGLDVKYYRGRCEELEGELDRLLREVDPMTLRTIVPLRFRD
ncbi:hypothetical protein FKP32DRAFT_1679509 [Trametes sanguinea]|nr:hypothetical protein FKP32DRAFT_1679509 [Trametes sanguinea]